MEPHNGSFLQHRQLLPLPDVRLLQKANILTWSPLNQPYDVTNKMLGVWKHAYFHHHRHRRAFSLHLKHQQQISVLWKTWNGSTTCEKAKDMQRALSDQQVAMEEGPTRDIPNPFSTSLQLFCNSYTPLETSSQFIAITGYSLIVYCLLPVLLLTSDFPSPGLTSFPPEPQRPPKTYHKSTQKTSDKTLAFDPRHCKTFCFFACQMLGKEKGFFKPSV